MAAPEAHEVLRLMATDDDLMRGVELLSQHSWSRSCQPLTASGVALPRASYRTTRVAYSNQDHEARLFKRGLRLPYDLY